jgi:asparagine synthase (glutamine-hydrolysing)
MCGLAGIVDLGGPVDPEQVRAMARSLVHRGPDAAGEFVSAEAVLGFRRLSIIDLSEAGNQPLTDESGRYRLVYNGEVYNYVELRHELETLGHRFRSRCDTEVVLHSFLEWGEGCVRRFTGMWALALWDAEERRLFCSRDRFGIKPLYYRRDGARLAFASELKALPRERANLRAVRAYLDHAALDHTDETFFDGLLRLPPAHNLVFSRDGLRLERYWELAAGTPPPGDPADAVRERFLDSIRLHLRSDVPVGTALSGGLDSSAVACGVNHFLRTDADAARPVGERQKTFTLYFEDAGFDERRFARAVVESTRTDGHWITYTPKELVDCLPAIVCAQEEPFGSTSITGSWFVMRAAAGAGMKVMLDGQGGDEVFGGYHTFFGARFADLLAQARVRELAAELRAYRRVQGASRREALTRLAQPFFPAAVADRVKGRVRGGGALLHPSLRALAPAPEPNGHAFPDRLRRSLARILTTRGLPELLRYEDRNSMAHSLEARVPFLDHRLVELLYSLDGGQLIERGRTKAILRRAVGDLLPPLVRDRTDKLGFVTPEARFMRGALGDLAGEVFASPTFAARGFVDPGAARARLAAHRRGELDAGFELWRALNLELWARELLDGGR